MTTLVSLKGKDFILIASDTAITNGYTRLPDEFPKVQIIDSCLVAGTGGVGVLQNLVKIAARNIRVDQVYNDNSPRVTLPDLVKHLSELNFSLPLEYKNFSSFAFILGGLSSEDVPEIFSIDADGSVLPVLSYHADGSGGSFAFSILREGYRPDITKEEAIILCLKALEGASELDSFTNNKPQIFSLEMNETAWHFEKYIPKAKEEVKPIEEAEQESKEKKEK